MNLTLDLLLIPIAYLIGSISFAVVVSKCMRLPDPHSYGSGNPGATNVLRTGNKLAAVLTLIGDALKGYLAVMLARVLLGDESLTSTLNSWLLCAVVIAVFLGHLFPIFHGFKGGKGVATACGILFGINWILGLATLSTWIIVAMFMRYSSLAALAAAIFGPIYFVFLFGFQPMGIALLVVCLLLIWRHRSNIHNLMNGKESRIGSKKKVQTESKGQQ
ncbi:MAG: glycerol-3-phosphate acyltransferase [Polynucleobacter sp. 24-46-87]|jgi:glycerol-3-phosphate acyltransferase PlsY|uniref:glycerol-3-phosphate 1-O-acyltransferase PlsY n=1 Tax=unclassified Polynucleobacter TaxID=2640945 RepID=UPI000BD953CA|nr:MULTISPECIES: glycerol-3-phosphate 1-O-acyltransferase PlsY [unclassified Polynucleobacter]OYY17217.1 MAG: glycerol-3-phosphate acyltransferase [Polynucleobacter sp. 35-46-11]OZA15978.1 MAG: glycerol-3-phosphate acyltransferase [Polynucleobacter sp. 24-46-87]OZA78273.1 MAG: glycerol-3-phosphate acyltransferase [Polynucleobacter sp. 39-46-10]